MVKVWGGPGTFRGYEKVVKRKERDGRDVFAYYAVIIGA
jgi:hypothetical protein